MPSPAHVSPSLKQIWSEIRWGLLALLWLVGLALGLGGFVRYAHQNGLDFSLAESLYRTLQLVSLNSGAVDGRINGMLEAARFLLPALTAYTALQAVMHLFQEQTQKLRLWGVRDHVIVCGLGRKGGRLARDLQDCGWQVVAIEKRADAAAAEDVRERGGVALVGDAADPDVLLAARVQRARHLICLLGEDRQNLRVALQAHRLAQSRRRGRLTCILHLSSQDLLNLVKRSELSLSQSDPFQLEIFNTYAQAARLLIGEDSAALPDALLVVGLGRLGQNLILQAGYLWRRAGRPGRLHVTVLDRDAAAKTARLLQDHPQLADAAALRPRDIELDSSAALAALLDAEAQPDGPRPASICLGDPVLSLQVALSLRQHPVWRAAPVRLRLEEEAGLSDLVGQPLTGVPEAQGGRFSAFDLYQQTCSTGLVVGGMHELLARHLRESFLQDQDTPEARRQLALAWADVPERERQANRQQADRIQRLLAEAGYQINPLQDWDAGDRTFSPDEVEQMARREHALWRAWLADQGWRHGSQRSARDRTHPDLVDWDDLPEAEREKNRRFIRRLPALLAEVGFQMDPFPLEKG